MQATKKVIAVITLGVLILGTTELISDTHFSGFIAGILFTLTYTSIWNS